MLSAAALLLTSSCQSDVMEEFQARSSSPERRPKLLDLLLFVNGIFVGKRQDVFVTFHQTTAGFFSKWSLHACKNK